MWRPPTTQTRYNTIRILSQRHFPTYLTYRHLHISTRLHQQKHDVKQVDKPSSNKESLSSKSSPTVPQYWRTHNIAKHIIQQEKLKAGGTNELTKKKSFDIAKHMRTLKRRSTTLARSIVDIVRDPSRLPPLTQRLWISVKHEAHHYWTGTKLLAAEVRTAYKLVRKTTKGHSLTRRERRQLRRTSQDLMRIVPFSVFVIVPFMELLLPVALKVFPNMLPSTYQTASFREQQLKRELHARLNVAGFLQESMESLAKQQTQAEDESIKSSAEELLNILKAVRSGQRVRTDDLARVAALFDNEITLDSFSHYQLVLICKLLSIPMLPTDEMMRYAIDMKMRRIHRDDAVIARDGMESLEDEELRAACRARGMRDFGLTVEGYRRNLQQWLDLSLNKRIPDSLLLLSRALSISEQPSAEDIRIALSSLSEQSLDEWATSAGISDNEQKLALVKRQNELIAQEEAEQQHQYEQKRQKESLKVDALGEGEGTSKSSVEQLQSDHVSLISNARQVVTDEKHDIGTLMEAILSMSQSSAVALERERLEQMIARVEQDERDEAEQALVKELRPRITSPAEGKTQQHPIQTLDDLAKWNAFQHQSDSVSSSHVTKSDQTQTDVSEGAPENIDEDEEDDKESAYQAKVRSQLLKQLKKLQARISEVDAEIGNKLHLVPTDSLGRIDETALHRALKQLTGASDELTNKTIERIKALANDAEEDDCHCGNVHLTLDDLKRLAQLQQEEQQDNK